MDPERTEHGDPIYRYKEQATGFTPADMSSVHHEAIDTHIQEHIGEISMVYHELISDLVHIDVHLVKPTDARPYNTLITSGMSDAPMSAPGKMKGCEYAELMLCLPPDWPMRHEDWKDERHYWPIRWLKTLARFPHKFQTWLWWGHTMPNGDPAVPLADDCPFTGVILAQPMTTSTDFWQLEIAPEKHIHFLSVIPLYSEEMALKLSQGANEVISRFDRLKISELVNLKRPNAAEKPRSKW